MQRLRETAVRLSISIGLVVLSIVLGVGIVASQATSALVTVKVGASG